MENIIPQIKFTAVVIEDENGQFTGLIKEIDGVVVQGKTEEEVLKNLPKALNTILNIKSKTRSINLGDHSSKSKVREQALVFEEA